MQREKEGLTFPITKCHSEAERDWGTSESLWTAIMMPVRRSRIQMRWKTAQWRLEGVLLLLKNNVMPEATGTTAENYLIKGDYWQI